VPISREEFKQRRIDLTLPVVKLLSDRPDLAFTAEEVRQVLTTTSARDATVQEVHQALEALVSHGEIEVAEIEGQRWYAYTVVERRLGFL
jgi:hypothetical protein